MLYDFHNIDRGTYVELPAADHLADMCGLLCAEQLVRILEKK